MLPTFIIGLREGLEAALIVGIIAAFLIQRGERKALRPMWYGVGLAVALCSGVALALEALDQALPHKQQEGLATILALLAVAGSRTWSWMKRHSRAQGFARERRNAPVLARARLGMAFFAVLREGLETAVFLLAASATRMSRPCTGAVGGRAGRGPGYATTRAVSGITCPGSSGSRLRPGARRRGPAGECRPHGMRPAGSTSCRRRRSTSDGWWLPGPSARRS